MSKKVFVDKDVCIGCSVCNRDCPEVFDVKQDPAHNGDFKSFPNNEIDHMKFADKINKAIEGCPAGAISWK